MPMRGEKTTWGLALVIYVGWGALTWFHADIPLWLLMPLGAWFVSWQGSLQHETIHGHPTKSSRINTLVGFPPLALIMPYLLYRKSHLVHHQDTRITDPIDDPESYYVTQEDWDSWPSWLRQTIRLQNALVGRLLLGPAIAAAIMWIYEAKSILAGDREHLWFWVWHLPAVAVLMAWVMGVCGMPLWKYALCFAYPGVALTLLRSYAEHRPMAEVSERSVIVEAGPVFELLYLGNNYHYIHHRDPGLAWYKLRGRYQEYKEAILADNGCYLFNGYGEIFRRFAFRLKDEPVHPFRHNPA